MREMGSIEAADLFGPDNDEFNSTPATSPWKPPSTSSPLPPFVRLQRSCLRWFCAGCCTLILQSVVLITTGPSSISFEIRSESFHAAAWAIHGQWRLCGCHNRSTRVWPSGLSVETAKFPSRDHFQRASFPRNPPLRTAPPILNGGPAVPDMAYDFFSGGRIEKAAATTRIAFFELGLAGHADASLQEDPHQKGPLLQQVRPSAPSATVPGTHNHTGGLGAAANGDCPVQPQRGWEPVLG